MRFPHIHSYLKIHMFAPCTATRWLTPGTAPQHKVCTPTLGFRCICRRHRRCTRRYDFQSTHSRFLGTFPARTVCKWDPRCCCSCLSHRGHTRTTLLSRSVRLDSLCMCRPHFRSSPQSNCRIRMPLPRTRCPPGTECTRSASLDWHICGKGLAEGAVSDW